MTMRDEAVQTWFTAHDAYHKASATYNQRLELVRAERERGNWSMKIDNEYRELNAAQSTALQADEALYNELRAGGGETQPRKEGA